MNRRPVLRALLASAAVVAAIALAGCNADSIGPTGRAQAPLSEKMLSLIAEKHMDKESPILVRIFKEESELEVWKQNLDGRYALLKTYPICRWSGALGPKKKEGDRQAPEGFYAITPGQMNPQSNYYLAFNTGYPNAFDRAWGRTGSELMVHGDCSSRGCYAMTDEQIQEIYALARESFFGGQKEFQLQAFPFRMTALNMAKHRNNPNFAFWKMLKEGYDHFEATRQEPRVAVCEKRYVFDAVAPDDASRPVSFNPRGKCPVHRLDPMIANAVLDRRRNEQYQMARYVADGVRLAPAHQGDGGMNPVFMAKTQVFDNSGRTTFQVASATGSSAPGALPRTANSPARANRPQPASAPEQQVASVPMPTPAPLPKEGRTSGEKPTTIASLLGNLFGVGTKTQARAAEPVDETVALRGSNTELAAKPKTRTRTANAAPVNLQAKPAKPAPANPGTVARAVPKPEAKPAEVKQAAKDKAKPAQEEQEKPQMRTAFSASPPATNGLLTGAQPVVPAGSFNARWSGLR